MINQYGGARKSTLGGMNVLTYFGFDDGDAWCYLGVIVAMFFGWSLLAWLALAYARNYKR